MTTHRVEFGMVGLFLLSLFMACSANHPTEAGSARNSNNGDIVEPCPSINDVVPVEHIAEMIYYEEPQYPRLAEQAGLEGLVWIKALVNRRGSVVDAVIYKSSGTPSLDEAARYAAQECLFKPGIQNGHPICMWVVYKVVFSLH
jgi:TonB family protein